MKSIMDTEKKLKSPTAKTKTGCVCNFPWITEAHMAGVTYSAGVFRYRYKHC